MVDRSKTFQIIANAVMILLVLFCLVPFALLIVSSITKETSLVKYGYSFIPREIDLAAYKYLLVDSTDIIRGYGISALVTVVGTICNLTITTLFAYPPVPQRPARPQCVGLFPVFYHAVQRWPGAQLHHVDADLPH